MNKLMIATAALAVGFCGCDCKEKCAMVERKPINEVRFITLDPGHFHAALVQNKSYEGVSTDVRVYAPAGSDVENHLNLIKQFNSRKENPTHWNEIVYTGNDYLARMLKEKAGNVVILAGKNNRKADYYLEAVKAGFNVLSDKPMAITPDAYSKLVEAVKIAEEKGLYFTDIMTERHEITTILQRAFSRYPELYGTQEKGTPEDPAVTKESVHHFCKLVNGKPLRRPAWYYDTDQQGEAIVDVTTHLTDLVQWELFPEQELSIDDVKMIKANVWATPITAADYEKSTGLKTWPEYLKKSVDNKGVLQCKANGAFTYQLKGVNAKVSVLWNFMPPVGGGDTHYSLMRGSKAELIILQNKETGFRPALFVKPRPGQDRIVIEKALTAAVEKESLTWKGIGFKATNDGWQITIPSEYDIGHEAHFSQVMQMYLNWLKSGEVPNWEMTNIIVKYYTLAEAWKMSR
jgi:predicted dehydrogenase